MAATVGIIYEITDDGSPWIVSVAGQEVGRITETLEGYVPERFGRRRTGPELPFRDSAIRWILEA
jgi:hypothetical protein